MQYLPLISVIIYLYLKFFRSYNLLQQNSYNENNRYLKFCTKNFFKEIKWYDYLFIVVIVSVYINQIFLITLLIYYILICLIYIKEKKIEQVKKPLVVTSRIKRLIIVTSLAISILTVFLYKNVELLYITLGTLGIISNLFIFLIFLICIPIEKLVFLKFYFRAKKKLKSMPSLKTVGITGSYGKTSSKNIMYDILEGSFNTLKTPKSFNTLNGLMIVINNTLTKLDDLFIAEMGAYALGDIRKLCNLTSPSIGVVTNIGHAHLESFKSRENIQKGKFELIESLPKGGLAVLNKDDDYQTSYEIKNEVNVVWISINNDSDFKANNIRQSHKGITFDLYIKEENKSYEFTTKLLGYNNVYNILAAIAVGYKLGIKVEKLINAVSTVKQVEHRLELKTYKHINIIDDAFNSNPVGSKMAVDVLGLMPNKKVIITPGMIELGKEQYNKNFEFGEHIATVCDKVVLIGKKQTKPIYDGLISKSYNKENIIIFNDVMDAFKYIEGFEQGTYVLLENDLPDIFNEGGKKI